MKNKKRPKLPRGLRWDPKSPYIFFSWRDERGKLHQKSTEKTDPAEALLFKIRFLEQQKEKQDVDEPELSELGKLSLKEVSDLYFKWKIANSAEATIERERRMFRNVLYFFGTQTRVKSIKLPKIRKYQQTRRQHVSRSMKQAVTPRTINYEMQLLRGAMTYAACWTPELAAYYKPLRQARKRKGKVASDEQLMKLISAAKNNEHWQLAMYCMAVAVGTGCRSCEIRNLQLQDIHLEAGKIRIQREIAKNRHEREPRLMALAEWGLQELLKRARTLGATEPQHYLLPLNVRKSRHLSKQTTQKWDPTRPMKSWVKSWRKLVASCGMKGFRFHDLRHTFRTLGAEAGPRGGAAMTAACLKLLFEADGPIWPWKRSGPRLLVEAFPGTREESMVVCLWISIWRFESSGAAKSPLESSPFRICRTLTRNQLSGSYASLCSRW